jgi:hypothetical protein
MHYLSSPSFPFILSLTLFLSAFSQRRLLKIFHAEPFNISDCIIVDLFGGEEKNFLMIYDFFFSTLLKVTLKYD